MEIEIVNKETNLSDYSVIPKKKNYKLKIQTCAVESVGKET